MGVEMEGLEFQIETTTDNAVKGVDALANTLGRIKALTKGGLGLGSSVKQLEKLDGVLKKLDVAKLEGLGKAMESISKVGEVKISGNVAKQISNIADAMDKITLADIERLEDMGKALRELGELSNVRIPRITVPSTGAGAGVTPTTDAAAPATSGMTQATSQVQETSAAVDQVTQKTGFLKSILNGIGGVFQKGFSLGTGALHKLGNALTKVATNAGKAVKNVMGFKKTSAGTASHVKHVTSGMGRLYESFKRIALYRLVRFALSALTKALKDGINNLYEYSNLMGGTFSQSMNSMATNAMYLKNSLGAMAAPIINALAPAIDFVCGKIATLLNMINMLIARLSGSSTYTAAKKLATAYGGAADSAAGAAKDAADKIKHYTSGIDELNIFQKQEDDASGGGGGGGSDYGSMFEEVPIDSNISDFADRLKQAFDNADWKTLGTLVGDKVNEIIDSIDYANIGSKLGFGINGAIQTAYYFLDTVDFHNIGVHVAELLNNALAEVDTSFIGKTLIQWFAIKWELLIGFLSELDWGLAASKLFDGFSGALNEVTSLLNQYDWSQLGTDLWTNIKDAVSSVDWAGVAQSIAAHLGIFRFSFLESFLVKVGLGFYREYSPNPIKVHLDFCPILDYNAMAGESAGGDALKRELRKQIDVLDSYIKLQDSLYKRAAAKIGISQVALYILAFLYQAEEPCTQNDFVEQWMHPKQTISFTVTKLAEQGLVEMAPLAGTRNKKAITLTAEGAVFCETYIAPVLEAEESAFSALTAQERDAFVSTARKHAALLEEKMNPFT